MGWAVNTRRRRRGLRDLFDEITRRVDESSRCPPRVAIDGAGRCDEVLRAVGEAIASTLLPRFSVDRRIGWSVAGISARQTFVTVEIVL